MSSLIDTFERTFSAATLGGLTSDTWDRFVRAIHMRLRDVEEKKADYEEAERLLISLGLQRINEALLPAFQTITGLSHLGAIFQASSTTTLTVGTGQKMLTISEEERQRFAPSGYLAIRATGQGTPVMTGYFVDYHRETGTLTVDVDQARGEGEHSDWTVSAAAAPDFASFADIRGDAPENLDTLEKIAQAIDNDPRFAETIGAALASLASTISNGLNSRVPNSRTITTSGLATGGGALSNNLTILVPRASASALRGGTDDTSALTAKSAFDASKEINLQYSNPLVIDFSAGTNFAVILRGSPEIRATGLNNVDGKMGRIRFIQDATGNREPTWDSKFVFSGGEAPAFSSSGGAEDRAYYDICNGKVYIAFVEDVQ